MRLRHPELKNQMMNLRSGRSAKIDDDGVIDVEEESDAKILLQCGFTDKVPPRAPRKLEAFALRGSGGDGRDGGNDEVLGKAVRALEEGRRAYEELRDKHADLRDENDQLKGENERLNALLNEFTSPPAPTGEAGSSLSEDKSAAKSESDTPARKPRAPKPSAE